MKGYGLVLGLGMAAFAAAASPVSDALVSSSVNQAVSIGSALYLRNQGFDPQIVASPNGGTTVVTAGSDAGNASAGDSSYEQQNQQQSKIDFMKSS